MSTLAATPATAPPAPHPNFNHPDSDVTLQSSDNILFRVHKANLCSASLVFKDMFLVGSPDQSPSSEPIVVSERAAALELLLAMCYPREEPIDFAKVENALVLDCYEMSVKYGMWVAGYALRSFVEPLVSTDPFRVVRLAHRLSDSVMLARAVEATLEINILADADALSAKTGPLWPNLIEYHFRYRQEVISVLHEIHFQALRCYCGHCINFRTNVHQAIATFIAGGPAAFPKEKILLVLGPNNTPACGGGQQGRVAAYATAEKTFTPNAVFKSAT